jgi:hypothetical protein
LQAKYAERLFKTSFESLTAAQRDVVFLEIVQAAGRPNPRWTALATGLGKAGKGVIIVSFAFAFYNVASSDRPGREAVKQSVSIGAGILGGAAAGLACGPGAPACVAIGALVGGIAFALATSRSSNRWPSRRSEPSWHSTGCGSDTAVLAAHDPCYVDIVRRSFVHKT